MSLVGLASEIQLFTVDLRGGTAALSCGRAMSGGESMKSKPIIFVATFLGACAVNPTVRYAVATNAADVEVHRSQLLDSFYLQRNELEISYRNTAAEGKAAKYALGVNNSRVADQSRRFLLLRGDRIWTRTRINLVKIDNTDLISSAGVEVQDRRVELIQNIGAIAKAVIPLAMGVSATGQPPCEVDPAQAPCTWSLPASASATRDGGMASLPRVITIRWGSVPVSARETATFVNSLPGTRMNGLFHSACRDVAITYIPQASWRAVTDRSQTVEALTWRGRIADPNWVEFVAFPRKGNIELHSQCGASVKTEADPTSSPDSVIAAAVAQAIAIRTAIEQADDD